MNLSSDEIIIATKNWVEKVVIGLNLCPFAKAVHVKKQIRYALSRASTVEILHADLKKEIQMLTAANFTELDTTLLVHPYVLENFLDYNDFLDVADLLLDELDLAGEIQVASFHPHYQFAGTAFNDISNYTNRSPFPTLHLLREASIDKAVAAFPDTAEIFNKNIDVLHRIGLQGLRNLGFAEVGQHNKDDK